MESIVFQAAALLFVYMIVALVALPAGAVVMEYVVPYVLRRIDRHLNRSRRGGRNHGRT